MDSIPDRILSDIIDHTVDLHRYEAGLQKSIRAMLQKLMKDLTKELAESGIDTTRTDWQRSRLTSLLKQATGLIDDGYDGIENAITEELGGMIEITSDAVISACNEAIGAELMLPVKWTKEMLRKLVDGTLIEGAPSSEWWSRQSDDLKQAFADEMRQGMLRGENLTQLRDRIMGQDIPGVNAVGKVDLRTVPKENRGLYWKARRNAETLVRSTVISTANAAHHAAYEANADIMAGEAWSACLDLRTCVECGEMDGQSWEWGTPHPMPALHFSCRCSLLPLTKSFEQLARESHGNSRIAKVLDDIPEANRASMGGPVSGKLTYKDWFSRLSESRQREILGPGRFDLYKKGLIGYSDMIGQNGNELTLAELRAKLA